jgi:hypothetical protein
MYHHAGSPSGRGATTRVASGVGLVSALLAAAATGCGDAGPPAPPDLARYFDATGAAGDGCSQDGSLAGRREVRLFVGGDGSELLPAAQGLARYFRRFGLEFFTRAPEQRIALNFVIDNRAQPLREAAADEFPGVNIEDPALPSDPLLWPQVRRFAMNFQLRPVQEFLRAHGGAGEDVTNIVVVPALEAARGTLPSTAIGMSLSRPLLTAIGKQVAVEPSPLLEVDLPAAFTPTIFLSASMLKKMGLEDPPGRDRAVAHELGHTGGLLHQQDVEDLDNLMFPSVRRGVDECAEQLTRTQLEVLRKALGLDTPSPAVAAAQVAPVVRGAAPADRGLPKVTIDGCALTGPQTSWTSPFQR